MATRLYLHKALSTITTPNILPTTRQSNNPTSANFEAQNVNRSMNITQGTGQQSVSGTFTANSFVSMSYLTRYVSDTLGQTSLAANTWTLNFAMSDSSAGSGNNLNSICNMTGPVRAALYVWRPTTGTKVSSIFDTDSSIHTGVGIIPYSESSIKVTYSGSAISTASIDDVLCLEIQYGNCGDAFLNLTMYTDGTTVTTTDNTPVSNHASYIETPEDVAFSGIIPGSISSTVTSKVITNKIIVKG